MPDSLQTSPIETLPVDMAVIGHAMRMSMSRDMALSGQAERVRMAVTGFLRPENSDWEDDIQDGGFFAKGSFWREYVGSSKNLRILTLLLCSGRTANFIHSRGKEPYADVKGELLSVLSQLNAQEKNIFIQHIWPAIGPYINNWDENYALLHSFNVFLVEDSLQQIKKIQSIIQGIFGIKLPEIFVNKKGAVGHISDERSGQFDTNIFIVDGAVPQNRESPGTVGTSDLISLIRDRFPKGIIISNTPDPVFLGEHNQAGAHYFGYKDSELLDFILRHIFLKKMTN